MRGANEEIETLLRQLANGSGAHRTESLPPECYRSEAFFDIEVERIFRRGWISVAHRRNASVLARYGHRPEYGSQVREILEPGMRTAIISEPFRCLRNSLA